MISVEATPTAKEENNNGANDASWGTYWGVNWGTVLVRLEPRSNTKNRNANMYAVAARVRA